MLIEATPEHAHLMAAIHAHAFPPGERWGTEAIALQLALPTTFGLLHEAGGMVMCRVAADEAELLTMGVDAAVRRQGIGGALLEGAMARSRQRGAIRMFLEVSVANCAARRLYARSGLRAVGRRAGYYPDRSDALVLRADLQARCACSE